VLILAGLAPVLGLVFPPAEAQEALPGVEAVAARLADPASGPQTLLDLAVILRQQQRVLGGEGEPGAEGVSQDRAWLDRLQAQFGRRPPRAPELDPAAWLVHQKLAQQQLPADHLLMPGDAALADYLRAVFQRDDERMAAAVLPELLWRLEVDSTRHWSQLLVQAASDERLAQRLTHQVSTGWAEPPGIPQAGQPAPSWSEALAQLAADALTAGPPDPRRLLELRYRLLLGLGAAEAPARSEMVAYLRLARLIDGLHERRYIAFAEGLVSVVAGLLEEDTSSASPVAAWLAAHLTDLSGAYARDFALVDPRINSAVAAVFDVAQVLAAGPPGSQKNTLTAGLADAVAQLVLMVPDLDYYFDLPVRDTIAGSLEACIGSMANRDPEGRPAMTRELFDDCQGKLVSLADEESRSPSLSGDPEGPFAPAQLRREVSVTAVQRINYGIGYLHQRYSTACAPLAESLPNPLEWSTLATLLAWFAEQSPVFFQTPENEARLLRMRAIGLDLLKTLSGQVDCFSGSGASVNDPVSRVLADYRVALQDLGQGLNQSIDEFRRQTLAPGADIELELDAGQETTYRPDDLVIGPCDAAQVCEMSGELSATRALLGLFPEPYLVADQSGMGEVQLCYQNLEWVDRRAEPVRPGDTNVANYFGRFAFDLKGRFRSDQQPVDVFGFRFTSPDEYLYLFAAASDEVLADGCPTEWLGSRIVTPLQHPRGGVVPNRLTYLAAARMLPSRLLALNWDQGAEWRDWFITGLGVEPLELASPPDIATAVNEHLQSLYRQEQAAVYDRLLLGEGPADAAETVRQLEALSTQKRLVHMLMTLLYPQSLLDSDQLRSAMAGQAGLLDTTLLNRFRQDHVPVDMIREIGMRRLDLLQNTWSRQPEATLRMGSISNGVVHALMRLDSLYRAYFAPVTPSGEQAAIKVEAEPGPVDG
jgi:hypothetical protein